MDEGEGEGAGAGGRRGVVYGGKGGAGALASRIGMKRGVGTRRVAGLERENCARFLALY